MVKEKTTNDKMRTIINFIYFTIVAVLLLRHEPLLYLFCAIGSYIVTITKIFWFPIKEDTLNDQLGIDLSEVLILQSAAISKIWGAHGEINFLFVLIILLNIFFVVVFDIANK